MNSYKLTWRLLSPQSTPLQSDTVFGHIAWAMVYLYGEERLEQTLGVLKERPALVCSSLFPQGKLPVPKVPFSPLIKEMWSRHYQADGKDPRLKWVELQKKMKKLEYIPARMLTAPEGYSGWWSIVEYLMQLETDPKKQFEKGAVFHNTINRLTGTTDESTGGPFAEVTSWSKSGWSKSGALFESWIDCDVEVLSPDELKEIVGYISASGFGKNKSTGRGRVSIKVEPFSWDDSDVEGNAWLLLSNAVPAATDSTDCHYNSLAKFPRLGGSFALTESPYKKPVFVLTPGSVFRGDKPRGVLLQNIHPTREEVVQNLYAYSIPIHMREAKQ